MDLGLTMENSDHLGLTLAGLILADLAPIMGLGLTMDQTMEPSEALEHSKTMVQDQDAIALVVVVAVALILVHPLKTYTMGNVFARIKACRRGTVWGWITGIVAVG